MTERLHLHDSYVLEFEAQALTCREGRPAAILDRTAFYAESGGQPWDTGTLGGLRRAAVETIGGPGGGRGNLAQGGVELLDEALARAAAAVRSL